jgi:DNA primase
VVGFSGRAVEEPYSGGKYINTRETLVYHKGSMFFGLNTAKEEIKKLDKAIIVEGELDVISCFSIGIKNVVAVKGTALTENQVALINRFTNNICLCFDKDDAGYEATKKSLVSLEKKGANITTCFLGNAKDADEAIKNDPIAFKKSIKKDIPAYDYIFSRTFSSMEKDRVYGKRKIASELLSMFMGISNEIVKEHYLRKLSLELDVSLDALSKEMEKIEKKEVVTENVFVAKKDRRSRAEILEDYLMSLIVQHDNPKLILEKCLLILKDYKFEVESYRKIINYLSEFFKNNNSFSSKKFPNILPKELVSSFDVSYLSPIPKLDEDKRYEAEVEKVAGELRIIFLKNKIREISDSLKKGEKDDDLKKVGDLEKELSLAIGLLGKT